MQHRRMGRRTRGGCEGRKGYIGNLSFPSPAYRWDWSHFCIDLTFFEVFCFDFEILSLGWLEWKGKMMTLLRTVQAKKELRVLNEMKVESVFWASSWIYIVMRRIELETLIVGFPKWDFCWSFVRYGSLWDKRYLRLFNHLPAVTICLSSVHRDLLDSFLGFEDPIHPSTFSFHNFCRLTKIITLSNHCQHFSIDRVLIILHCISQTYKVSRKLQSSSTFAFHAFDRQPAGFHSVHTK